MVDCLSFLICNDMDDIVPFFPFLPVSRQNWSNKSLWVPTTYIPWPPPKYKTSKFVSILLLCSRLYLFILYWYEWYRHSNWLIYVLTNNNTSQKYITLQLLICRVRRSYWAISKRDGLSSNELKVAVILFPFYQ